MWDDVMISPFSILIGIDWVAVCLFVHGVVGVMECPVVPESATASREESLHMKLKFSCSFLLLLTKLLYCLSMFPRSSLVYHSGLCFVLPPIGSALVAAL